MIWIRDVASQSIYPVVDPNGAQVQDERCIWLHVSRMFGTVALRAFSALNLARLSLCWQMETLLPLHCYSSRFSDRRASVSLDGKWPKGEASLANDSARD